MEFIQESVEADSAKDPVSGSVDQYSLAKALGMDRLGEIDKYSHQLDRLKEWADMKGAKDNMDAVWMIKELANRVGGPPLGNNIVQHLSQYAYLEMERMRLDKQLRQMENAETTSSARSR